MTTVEPVYEKQPLQLSNETKLTVGITGESAYVLWPDDDHPHYYPFATLTFTDETPEFIYILVRDYGLAVKDVVVKTKGYAFAPINGPRLIEGGQEFLFKVIVSNDKDTPIHIYFSPGGNVRLPVDPMIIVNPPTYP